MEKKRIEWIDLAKGITILLVIIGHTTPVFSMPRNFIFSFHMPLFFILSGFTFRYSTTWEELWRKTRHDFIQLFLTAYMVGFVSTVISTMEFYKSMDVSWAEMFIMSLKKLYWSSAFFPDNRPVLGMSWFLVSLFFVRLFQRMIGLYFIGENKELISVFLGIIGIFIGSDNRMLPLNLDVTLVSLLFFASGILFKRHWDELAHKQMNLWGSIIVWISILGFGIYAELGTRHYPYIGVSILEALAGSYAVCRLCEELARNSFIRKVGGLIGRHTFIILIIHALDFAGSSFWQRGGYYVSSVFRIIFVLAVATIILFIQNFMGKLYTKNGSN